MAEFPDSMNWMNFWGDLQKQSMDNWQSMMRKSAPTPSSAMENPLHFWQDNVTHWWRAMERGATPTPEQSFFRSTSAAGEWFLKLGEEIFRAMQAMQTMQDGSRMGRDWTDTLNRMVQQGKDTIGKTMVPDMGSLSGLMGSPMEAMQKMMSMSSMMPGDMFKPFQAMMQGMPGMQGMMPGMQGMMPGMGMMQGMMPGMQEMMAGMQGMMPGMQGMMPGMGMMQGMMPGMGMMFDPKMKASLQQMMSTPAVGITREWQEKGQQAILHLVECQEATKDYMTLIAKALTAGMDLFHKRLLERGANDKPIHSLKELYSLMVDCGEEALGEMNCTNEYITANSRMVNAMLQVKKHQQSAVDEMVMAIGMPSRSELDTAHRSITELKRRLRGLEDEVRALKRKDVEPAVAALKENVEQLPIKEFRSELEKLKKQMQDSLTDKGEGEGDGDTGDIGEGDDKTDPIRAAIRRTRTTRAKPQSEGA